jgi:hypothetical protein
MADQMTSERLAEIEQDVDLEAEGLESGHWTDTIGALIAEVRRLQGEVRYLTLDALQWRDDAGRLNRYIDHALATRPDLLPPPRSFRPSAAEREADQAFRRVGCPGAECW